MTECRHITQEWRKDEAGTWCRDCGVKVYDVETRQCKDCTHSEKLLTGTICSKRLMAVSPGMNVTFKLTEGSCWMARPNAVGKPTPDQGGRP